MANQRLLATVGGDLVEQFLAWNDAASEELSLDASALTAPRTITVPDTDVNLGDIPQNSATLTASQAVAAGEFGTIHNDGGTAKIRAADPGETDNCAACYVPASIASGNTGTVQFPGQIITGLSGLTPGPVYLSTTPGGTATTPPASARKAIQLLGYALSATSMRFQPQLISGAKAALDILGDGSCVELWTFDGDANGISGSYNGTPTNMAYATGKLGQAAQFESGSKITTALNVNAAGTYSLSFWVNTAGLPTRNDDLIAFGTGARITSSASSSLGLSIHNPSVAERATAAPMSANTWVHVCLVVIDGSSVSDTNIKWYFNGVLQATSGSTSGSLGTGGNLIFSNATTFVGALDEVRFFNKALSASEVNTVYTGDQ